MTRSRRTAPWLDRYEGALLNLFGRPQLVLEHGDGAWVWDVDGRRYLDLVGGIAVNALGHNHPALVAAVSKQAGQLVHVSNFFTSVPQVELAERLLSLAGAPTGSKVFFCNSGAEALEAAIKLARRTGRTGIVAAEGAFHGRTTGALALTHKPAYREPFEPLIPGVTHVPWGDVDALRAAVDRADLGARARAGPGRGRGAPGGPRLPASGPRHHPRGRRPARARRGADRHRPHRHVVRLPPGRCGARRDDAGQGPGRRRADRRADDLRPRRSAPCSPPACTARPSAATRWPVPPGSPCSTPSPPRGCSTTPARPASTSHQRIGALDHPQVTGIRGVGLLQAITLAGDHSAAVAALARDAGFIVNPVAPDAIRLAPPLVVTTDELDLFVDALPGLLDAATAPPRLRQGRPMTLRHFLADDDLTAGRAARGARPGPRPEGRPLLGPLPGRPAHGVDPVRQAHPAHPGVVRRRGRRARRLPDGRRRPPRGRGGARAGGRRRPHPGPAVGRGRLAHLRAERAGGDGGVRRCAGRQRAHRRLPPVPDPRRPADRARGQGGDRRAHLRLRR